MKTVFNFILASSLLAASTAAAEGRDPVARLAALVDYVAADYPGAVKGGQIIAPSEYEEQGGMVAEARALARTVTPRAGHDSARPELAVEVARLDEDFRAHVSEERLAADSRAIHKRLLDDYGLVLSPIAPPDAARAQTVYASSCAPCHGATGHADTEQAKTLKPPPVDFFDGERMSRISPQVAFHALTFGVTNTSMASFETLPASDRWSLAFYVVSLRHQTAASTPAGSVDRGERAFAKAQAALAPSASRLGELSDLQLDALLQPTLSDGSERAAAIAWLRVRASFATAPGGTFGEARRLLTELGQHADDRARAKDLAVAAYLDGIEPHEATLKAHDRPLADRIEHAFFELRRVIDSGASADAIRGEVARTTLVLDGAEERGRGGKSVPFLAALAIAVREGFELSLLIAALLAFVRKSGHGDYARYIHLGWLAAVPAGLVTWFVIGAALAGARRELTEGVLTLVAASMLLFVSHFVLGKLESRKWLKFLERKTRSAANDASGVPWPLVAVAFVAAYREAIEIVLFFRALVLDAPGAGLYVLAGAATGIAILVVIVRGMSMVGKRLNPRPLMQVSSVLLTAIAISLVGQGIRALQEGGYAHLEPVWPALHVPVLGIFPSAEGLASQGLVLALVLVPAWLERRKASRTEARATAKGA